MNLKNWQEFLGKNGIAKWTKAKISKKFWIQFNFKGKNGAGMIPSTYVCLQSETRENF